MQVQRARFIATFLTFAACSQGGGTFRALDGGHADLTSGGADLAAADLTTSGSGADMTVRPGDDLTMPDPVDFAMPPVDQSVAPLDLTVSMTTTIAAARSQNVTSPITVMAVVTGVRGTDPVKTRDWYIQDPSDGGPYSGVAVFCNRTQTTNPCPMGVPTPALHDLVSATGTLVTYKGRVEFHPTAMTVLSGNAPPPPLTTVTAVDASEGVMSTYRGVRVQFSDPLTVTNTTPPQFYNARCRMGDAGGMPLCTGCTPPTYSGFEARDPLGSTIAVTEFFYFSEHLQSSPECLSQPNARPVQTGTTFSSLIGILDLDTNANVQVLSPVQDSDYVTP